MIADGDRRVFAPGAIMLDGRKIQAAGSPRDIGEAGSGCRVIDLPHSVVIPALVNAHTHLDLTHIGPIPPEDEFIQWVNIVRRERAMTDEQIDASVRLGAELCRAGGTAIVGDIAGITSLQPIKSLRQTGMRGVSFLEVFGVGHSQTKAIERMRHAVETIPAFEPNVALGLQPHAPYSCGLDVYRAAVDLNRPLSTHLAETVEELEFVRDGTGPIARMLREIGVWNDGIKPARKHSIDHLEPVLRERPMLAAHVNYLDDEHLEKLSRWPVSIAYCPRASAYFGHATRLGAWDLGLGAGEIASSRKSQAPSLPSHHRYRDMLSAGINVALGTDSILCLDTSDRISVLDDMRFLFLRDSTDPLTLLRMATINGAKALGFDPALVTLAPGEVAGLLAIDVDSGSTDLLHALLMSNAAPRWID